MVKFKLILLLILSVVATLTFQNCSQFSEAQDSVSSFFSEQTPIESHYASVVTVMPQQQMRIVNRRYVAELFRDIFTAADGQTADNMDRLIFHWALKRGAQMGGNCDLLGSTTGADCNGDFGNANQSSYTDPNAVRESFKIQLCEELIGQDKGLSILLSKIGYVSDDLDPFSKEKMKLAYELFYRTDEIPNEYIESFRGFVYELKQNSETNENIWRGLFILICESPDWQKL
ncbi:MAG: hypothetical protein HUU56_03295 [Bdellovibrionaceae bacterium]|nr:hypothetical protein [Pseudobdellovibrionaceae bacterium]